MPTDVPVNADLTGVTDCDFFFFFRWLREISTRVYPQDLTVSLLVSNENLIYYSSIKAEKKSPGRNLIYSKHFRKMNIINMI